MAKKHTYEYVKNYFEEQGCELLSKEYKNAHQILDYACSCGNKSKINFNSFQYRHKCSKCGYKETANKLKHSYKYVEDYFKSQKCELLSNEYKNVHQKLDYVCSCGNIAQITFNNFQKGERCMQCSGNPRHSYEYVYNFFKENGCELLSIKYNNAHDSLNYICCCGKESIISFNSFQQGSRCRECGDKINSDRMRFSYNYVKSYFESQGCKLISNEYINAKQLLDYQCSCGNISKIKFLKFLIGQRCAECKGSKGEKKISNWLKLNNCNFEPQKSFDNLLGLRNGNLSYDFYLPQYSLLIEYQGEMHERFIKGIHKSIKDFEKQKEHDRRKKKYAQNNNIDLLEIWYWDYDNIEQILDQQLYLLKVVV